MLVVGERDVEAQTVSPRRHKGRPEAAQKIEEFLARVREEVAAKKKPELAEQPVQADGA
jgi:threonyl-tRNA synthetase